MADNGRRNARDNSRAGFEKRQKRRQIRALQEAIDNHDFELVKKSLDDDFDVDFQYRSQTALQLAVKEGCKDICKLLIEKGANVNMRDAEMNNLLNMACFRGYKDIAELLVDNGSNIDDQNIQGCSSMHTCVQKGQPDILQMLISYNGDLDSSTLNGRTALHMGVCLQQTEMVQLLVIGGCKIDKEDENRRTPLMLAAELGYADIIQLLVHGGADINKRDNCGSTALCDAARNGHLNAVEGLVALSADINLPTTKGATPLLESITNDHMDISLFLIKKKCDVNQMDRRKIAPIHLAVSKVSQFFHEEVEQVLLLIRNLVEAGCDLNVPNMDGERALYQSACGGNLELTQFFLSKNVDLTVKTKTGETILHGAVYGNQPLVVDSLIQAGCLLNEKNEAGEHPLMAAIVHHSDLKDFIQHDKENKECQQLPHSHTMTLSDAPEEKKIIEMLIKNGSSLDTRDKAGSNTPLHNAILHYYSKAAELLIDEDCDVNALNGKRHSPLYLACERDEVNVVEKILESPKFSKKLFSVYTIPQPLYAAISNNHVKLVNLLLQWGCDINMVNMDGLTPLQLALQENCPFIIKLLLSYNCDLEAHAKTSRLYKCCLQHEDRHPHFDLEPLFLALTHKSVDILQTLCWCYWKIPHKMIRMLDKVFKSTPDLNTHFTPALKAEIHELFQYHTRTPRNLQEICRAMIRSKLQSGSEFASVVDCLPLAHKHKQFIMMEEMFGDLHEKIEQQERDHPSTFSNFHSQGTFE